jgi:hypothetical protein
MLDVMKVEPEPEFRSSRDIEVREQQQREAAERARRDADNAAHRAQREDQIKTFYSMDGASIMQLPTAMHDEFSGLEKGPHVEGAGQEFMRENPDLGTDDLCRIGKHAESCAKFDGCALNKANLYRSFQRLQDLGCLEYQPAESQEPEQPAPRVNVEELIAKGDGSRESDDRIKHAIAEEVVGRDFAAKWQEWSDHMVSVWGVSLTKPMHEFAWRTCLEQNLSPLSNKTYDILRRALVRDHYISDANLTSEEVISAAVSSGTMSQRDFFSQQRRLQLEGKLNRPRVEGGV